MFNAPEVLGIAKDQPSRAPFGGEVKIKDLKIPNKWSLTEFEKYTTLKISSSTLIKAFCAKASYANAN